MLPAGRIGMLVCDFDDTITQKDTIGTLLGVAAESAAKAAPPAAAQEARQLVQAAASQLSAGYVAQLQELLDESLNPQVRERRPWPAAWQALVRGRGGIHQHRARSRPVVPAGAGRPSPRV